MYGVQQLVIERQIYPDSPVRMHIVLEEVRMIIQRIEKSMVYLRRWAKSHGWDVCFGDIEWRYYLERRSSNHPCFLLQPYIVEIPIAHPPKYIDDD